MRRTPVLALKAPSSWCWVAATLASPSSASSHWLRAWAIASDMHETYSPAGVRIRRSRTTPPSIVSNVRTSDGWTASCVRSNKSMRP
eukprot:scaffold185394_cov37-Tisochrysis_lutea.AAC.2